VGLLKAQFAIAMVIVAGLALGVGWLIGNTHGRNNPNDYGEPPSWYGQSPPAWFTMQPPAWWDVQNERPIWHGVNPPAWWGQSAPTWWNAATNSVVAAPPWWGVDVPTWWNEHLGMPFWQGVTVPGWWNTNTNAPMPAPPWWDGLSNQIVEQPAWWGVEPPSWWDNGTGELPWANITIPAWWDVENNTVKAAPDWYGQPEPEWWGQKSPAWWDELEGDVISAPDWWGLQSPEWWDDVANDVISQPAWWGVLTPPWWDEKSGEVISSPPWWDTTNNIVIEQPAWWDGDGVVSAPEWWDGDTNSIVTAPPWWGEPEPDWWAQTARNGAYVSEIDVNVWAVIHNNRITMRTGHTSMEHVVFDIEPSYAGARNNFRGENTRATLDLIFEDDLLVAVLERDTGIRTTLELIRNRDIEFSDEGAVNMTSTQIVSWHSNNSLLIAQSLAFPPFPPIFGADVEVKTPGSTSFVERNGELGQGATMISINAANWGLVNGENLVRVHLRGGAHIVGSPRVIRMGLDAAPLYLAMVVDAGDITLRDWGNEPPSPPWWGVEPPPWWGATPPPWLTQSPPDWWIAENFSLSVSVDSTTFNEGELIDVNITFKNLSGLEWNIFRGVELATIVVTGSLFYPGEVPAVGYQETLEVGEERVFRRQVGRFLDFGEHEMFVTVSFSFNWRNDCTPPFPQRIMMQSEPIILTVSGSCDGDCELRSRFPFTWEVLSMFRDHPHYAGSWLTENGTQRNIGVTCPSRIPDDTRGVIYHVLPFSTNYLEEIRAAVGVLIRLPGLPYRLYAYGRAPQYNRIEVTIGDLSLVPLVLAHLYDMVPNFNPDAVYFEEGWIN